MEPPMNNPGEEHVVYEFFFWSVLLKGVISFAEVVAGVALFFIPQQLIVAGAIYILNLVPVASLQNALFAQVATLTAGTVTFVAIYLLSRGLIKVFLVWSLLKNRLWAYPASLLVLALFVCYQVYQIFKDHSLIVGAITVFDLIVMYFIYREWRIVVKHRSASPHT